jgi:hypothetical protein
VVYIESRKVLGSAKKKKIVRAYPNNNNDLAGINLNRKRSDTLSVDEENAIVSNELSQNNQSSVIEGEEISGEYYFEDNSIMF